MTMLRALARASLSSIQRTSTGRATWRLQGQVRFASSATVDVKAAADERIRRLFGGGSVNQRDAHDFSFGGCGFLISYELGVAQGLKDIGYLQPSSKVAGASGGAIVALCVAADQDLTEIHEDAKAMAAFCRREGVLWKLQSRLSDIYQRRIAHIPMDCYTDRLIITTLQLWPKQETVHSRVFASSDELRAAVLASCHIPMYLSPDFAAKYRGEMHIDGGFLEIVPEIPDFVKICAFHADILKRADYEISPSIDPAFPFGIMQLARYALMPPDPAVLEQLFHLGRQAAAIWAEHRENNLTHS